VETRHFKLWVETKFNLHSPTSSNTMTPLTPASPRKPPPPPPPPRAPPPLASSSPPYTDVPPPSYSTERYKLLNLKANFETRISHYRLKG
jgi:hypothetical protein